MCFCSIYFNPKGGRPGIISPQGIDIDPSEFPSEWFDGLEDDMYKARRYNVERNKHKVQLHTLCPLHHANVQSMLAQHSAASELNTHTDSGLLLTMIADCLWMFGA